MPYSPFPTAMFGVLKLVSNQPQEWWSQANLALLPKRELGIPPQTTGPLKNRTLDMEAMTTNYFEFLGIDPDTTLPLPETVQELDLESFNLAVLSSD
jgi:aldehyde:ferredoxin oxidoreductase